MKITVSSPIVPSRITFDEMIECLDDIMTDRNFSYFELKYGITNSFYYMMTFDDYDVLPTRPQRIRFTTDGALFECTPRNITPMLGRKAFFFELLDPHYRNIVLQVSLIPRYSDD